MSQEKAALIVAFDRIAEIETRLAEKEAALTRALANLDGKLAKEAELREIGVGVLSKAHAELAARPAKRSAPAGGFGFSTGDIQGIADARIAAVTGAFVTSAELAAEVAAQIDYPVDSVNGQTGAVSLNAANVGADPSGTAYAAVSSLTKADVGLGNVDNTSDAGKPVSAATQAALDAKAASGHNHDAAYEALGAVATHAGQADPHAVYQKEAEKGAANGYAGLDGAGLVPVAQLPALPAAWGAVTGTLSSQADLQSALDAKSPTSHNHDASYSALGHSHAVPKLDDLTAPDDNTDLNASTSAHGLCPKFPGGTTTFLRADNTWASPGASSTNIKETEVDFGTAVNQRSKSFTVTDADVSGTSQLIVTHALSAATGKSQDENEMDALVCRAVPGTGQFTVFVESLFGSVAGPFKLHYLVG